MDGELSRRLNNEKLNGIISENLELLNGEYSSVFERRLTQLYDRAQLLARDSALLTSEERCAEFERMFDPTNLPPEASDEAKRYVKSYSEAQLLSDKLTVCRFLAERLGSRADFGELLGQGSAKLGSDGKGVRIAYLQNAYADAAFRRFSEVLDSPSVTYPGDFTSVCEEVYYGRAELCMLPLDSSRDAKLISFYRLIDKYELKIILSCDVASADGGVTTRYALLGKSAVWPDYVIRNKCGSLFFEFSFVPDEERTLADVLSAAGQCGLRLYKTDAIPLSYSDSEFSCDVILDCQNGELNAFVLYMMLAVPQYELLGVYPHMRNG